MRNSGRPGPKNRGAARKPPAAAPKKPPGNFNFLDGTGYCDIIARLSHVFQEILHERFE
jgi:hypothetical protein